MRMQVMVETESVAINLPQNRIAAFCRRHRVTRLALFGSVVSGAFSPDSDVDVLVTFAPNAQVGFLKLSRMQRELADLLDHPVDLVPESGLKPLIRDDVLASSREIYEA